MTDLRPAVEAAWDAVQQGSPLGEEQQAAVAAAMQQLDSGELRVAERICDNWVVHEWLKKAVLVALSKAKGQVLDGGPGGATWWDKASMKFDGWTAGRFEAAGIRAVPGSLVRYGAHVGSGAVLMPSFINLGARVGAGTMIDTWATVGSCAQVGVNCHISGGVGIGGVLEPLQARPTIIEDGCFIGARSEVAEGVVVREGSVLAMGVFLSASTTIVDRASGRTWRGEIPPYSVVVPGTYSATGGPVALSCAVIVKQVTELTRAKTSINDLLRE
jgi:2,3,4,5-tetrahydropyridine-2-carboxylate N-succinyltransferase